MLGTMYRWCVAAFISDLWNISIPIDQVLDGRAVQIRVKIDELFEQWWPPEQHQGKKSGHMYICCVTKDHLGTICLQQDSDHACLWPGYYLK